MFQQINDDIVIKIKVIPKASRSEVVGWELDHLKIRLAAVPDKGAANRELVRFLADFLGVAKSRIRVLRGETSRHKWLAINGMALEFIRSKLE